MTEDEKREITERIKMALDNPHFAPKPEDIFAAIEPAINKMLGCAVQEYAESGLWPDQNEELTARARRTKP